MLMMAKHIIPDTIDSTDKPPAIALLEISGPFLPHRD